MDSEKCAEMTKKVLQRARKAFPMAKDLAAQGDNATPHAGSKESIEREAKKLKIELITQPAQSPDLNELDLVVFPAMQQRVDAVCAGEPKTPDAVMKAARQVWDELTPGVIHMAFEIKRIVMQCIIEHNGGNNFKIPHIGARRELKAYIEALNKYFESQVETDDEAPGSESDDDKDPKHGTNQEAGTSSGVSAKQRKLIATSWQAKEVRGGSTSRRQKADKGKGKSRASTSDNESSDSDARGFIMHAPTNACRVPTKRKK
ncbi:hypothetical protein CYMTET_12017 [Cymbomonas tetramitiformis]|uniref:Uncharacterized protein n=2 Tax=Cymbomonas tetramitiformis TaxID=36881 RepID=A0AAE0GMK4_9CHLO|nr:hypothetical protein CYMTET_12017 [Cymbomonas tetramitiformis]